MNAPDTFIVFCAQTTRMFDNMGAALNAAFYESSINHFISVPVYGLDSADGQASVVLATVQANKEI